MNTVRKYIFIKKFIIPILTLAVFLLPLQPNFEVKKVEINRMFALDAQDDAMEIGSNAGVKDTTADYTIVLLNTGDLLNHGYIKPTLNDTDQSLSIVINLYQSDRTTLVERQLKNFRQSAKQQNIPVSFGNLTPNTEYFWSATIFRDAVHDNSVVENTVFTTSTNSNSTGTTTTTTFETNKELDLRCGVGGWLGSGSLYGCIAGLFWLIFQVAALLGHLGAIFLDFLVNYSTNSTSYSSLFVSKGWGAVRDIANIFFIIALLYIAIKMILSLGDSHSKKLISTIIIVALVINFSLFITQVVIDGSNILAKVFYNNIDAKYDNQKPAAGAKGEKSISLGLMNKFNPESVLTQKQYDDKGGTTTYIFITLILTLIVLYAAYIFFSIGLLFVSRVVMLWFCMIFAPIAFASYTLPFDIPGLGHKEWWKNLFENAFLAPIFIFMLYIIVMFAGFLGEIVKYPDGADFMQKIMSIAIPFVILMVLLMKAKEMAVKYAGEMGKAINKAGAVVGGFAVGTAAGGIAIAGRAGLGRAGSAIANSDWAKKWESKGYGGATFRNIAKAAGKGSFDIRGAKIGGKSLADTGLKVGKGKEGGFEKVRADKTEKRLKRAKELETGPDSKLVKEVRAVEIAHQDLVGKYAGEIERLDKTIEKKRQAQLDAKNRVDALQRNKAPQAQIDAAKAEYALQTKEFSNAKLEKAALTKGGVYEEEDEKGVKTGKTVNYAGAKINYNGVMRSMDDLEKTDIPAAQNELKKYNFNIRKQYVQTLSSKWNKTANFISSRGVHSNAGLAEAAHKIRMDIKLDSGTKTH